MAQASKQLGKEAPRVTHDDGHRLQPYEWPGNIWELQHVIERAGMLSKGGRLRLDLALTDAPAVTAPTSHMSRGTPDAVVTDHAGANASAPIS
jgi:DNA-binding NtrC family response regulator